MTSIAPAPVVNISTYKFVELTNLESRRETLRRLTHEHQLRGTILLSPEGINLFVAGDRSGIDALMNHLNSDPLLADLVAKESPSDYQPFNRMLIKIKKEIIAFGIDEVAPGRETSPKLPAKELKRWLDAGKRVHLLDVRNDYEIDVGTFENAVPANVDSFREFPDAIRRLPESMKGEPVVMFCTGGIRCEKAGPFMEKAGFQEIYQLDGGILKYFEECGGDHYDGDCFVFDQRVAVDSALKETGFTQCYLCQAVVSPEQQESEEYVAGKSCPACWQPPQEAMAQVLFRRQQRLQEVVIPLPGSVPYYNRRPLNVPARFADFALIDFLCAWHPHIDRDAWLQKIAASEVVPSPRYGRRQRRKPSSEESLPLSPNRRVRPGERLEHLLPGTVEPDVSTNIEFLYEDDQFVVTNKPAPLPLHPGGRYNRNTLQSFLNAVYAPQRLLPAHRLDANTTGVLVLCRKRSVARVVQKQFEERTVAKTYLARVHGHPAEDSFQCVAAISREAGAGGVREITDEGLEARTLFQVAKRLPDGSSLIKVTPVTGRTNQIRLHLWHLGLPIVNDPVWLPDGETAENCTQAVGLPTLCLHASSVILNDTHGKSRRFSAPTPDWWESDARPSDEI